MKGTTAIRGTSVFIVLEHACTRYVENVTTGGMDKVEIDAIVHGVYSNRAAAICKMFKVEDRSKGRNGYVCVLKKTIRGKLPKVEHICADLWRIED